MKLLLPILVSSLLSCQSTPTAPALSPAVSQDWIAVRSAVDAASLEVPARVLAGPGALTLVTPPLRATIVRIRVRAGDVVDAGAPLVDVVMPELLDAAGRLEGARVRLSAWTERAAQLTALRAEGLAKSLDVSEAAARVAESKADAQAARAILLSAGVRDGEAAQLLSGAGVLSLRAAAAGVVTAVSASVGESREPAAGPLLQLASAGPVRVEARFVSALSNLARYEFVGASGSTPLTLVSLSPTADPRDGTFLAWFDPEHPLPAGTLGRLVVRGQGAEAAFLVPARVLHRSDGQARVETKHGAVPVDVLRCEAVDCVIRGALTVGEDVSAR